MRPKNADMSFPINNLVYKKIIPAVLFSALVVLLIILGVFSTSKQIETNTDRVFECQGCNLVIISLTNTRKDHLGIYGYNRDTTPNIDEFFKNSLIFENVFAPSPWTLPNAVSLFTSLFPRTHQVVNRREGRTIPKESPTLAEMLQRRGYTTAAFVGGGDYNSIYGFDRGFDEYDDKNDFSGISDKINDVVRWLEDNRKEKFFLFVQGFDTHCPFDPPYPYSEKFNNSNTALDTGVCYWNLSENHTKENGEQKRYSVYKQGKGVGEPTLISLDEADRQSLIALYDGEILYADSVLEKLFSTITDLGLGKNTIIVFLSEHGDLLGENGRFMRTDIRGTFTDSVLNIPFLIRHPSVTDVERINGLVQLVDIFPTLLFLLDIKFEEGMLDGKTIAPLIFDNQEVNMHVFASMKYVGSKENRYFKDVYEVSMVRNLREKFVLEETTGLDGVLKLKKEALFRIDDSDVSGARAIHDDDKVRTYMSVLERWKR